MGIESPERGLIHEKTRFGIDVDQSGFHNGYIESQLVLIRNVHAITNVGRGWPSNTIGFYKNQNENFTYASL